MHPTLSLLTSHFYIFRSFVSSPDPPGRTHSARARCYAPIRVFADDPWHEAGFGDGVDEVLHLVSLCHERAQPLVLQVLGDDDRVRS